MKNMLLAAGLVTCLAGCGSMNAYTGAAINAGESGYAGAKQNLKAIDDAKFIGWADIACTLPLGALQRNATGNPDAVKAVLTACPIPNLAVVSTSNGSISVMTLPNVTAPTPTTGYVAPAATTATGK
ncbi:hypothetical protein PQR71_42320 [Paraburkholderia fungorum]|uniref:hypothetical protein n=1 Tax=Paraburkholderia fungorum TaxID=134537 RepID=UPI0038B81262